MDKNLCFIQNDPILAFAIFLNVITACIGIVIQKSKKKKHQNKTIDKDYYRIFQFSIPRTFNISTNHSYLPF